MNNKLNAIKIEEILSKIYYVRGQKVMLDRDLAELYGVETKVLNQSVKRNADRFPPDFMFALDSNEANSLRSQFVTLKRGEHSKYLTTVFTEPGVAMLSSVLRSERAIKVNIEIVRVFIKIRQMIMDNTELRLSIEKLERKTENNGKNIEVLFRYFDELIEKEENPIPRKEVGYKLPSKK